jgi:FMN phosphatase YigB (HAD superfamily)
MRISFDLDDTLICYQTGVPQEPRLPWYLAALGGNEPLRLGARSLIRQFREHGWEVWVYTTSHRPPRQVWWWFWGHGARIGRVINQDTHDRYLRRTRNDYPPSKNPRAFGIDLHVDDSEGVRMEGRQHGLRVIVVSPDDTAWVDKVWHAAALLDSRLAATSHPSPAEKPSGNAGPEAHAP